MRTGRNGSELRGVGTDHKVVYDRYDHTGCHVCRFALRSGNGTSCDVPGKQEYEEEPDHDRGAVCDRCMRGNCYRIVGDIIKGKSFGARGMGIESWREGSNAQ